MSNSTETIVFGGGCFWCIEAVFQMLRGVESVTSGYAGGEKSDPNYYQVVNGNSGHAEVVQIEYDPVAVSLENLYAVFFTTHDPTTRNRQGADVGTQYRSVIYYTTPEQKIAAENYIEKLTDAKVFVNPIVTELEALQKFYPAETYHQNYYQNNQDSNPYCQVVIDPKIAKIRQQYAHLLKK
ncbi:MAG: peptide-methionine (S)-S-oxide reductase [Candidatus Magasanikbacteria bacterium RIFCSPHIGHO2_01_FULL_41_23]|uniref:Peptide methionine sulfoxide reductase MsrA n=1 Tax=Candidatus Magasanikbacteria bacterium RIFCSPLOWO2_01_FULL_40_15 TaxID=1798686 RepID=A0A1F6N2U1_9BACT|nr:MAG: peptide-methionine (S)-S-oxide reductase [Candidatus Magasanikbacteria bacterium RIFCSPHIGHO2_01_FULL_41_23]OGH66944.1 MAG: peptide-methionine (S)-S-oxide reductase [Candidatus Magasanikbacteria bacterium RIFCSPHIGHO2_02_FULL_41_35]OGH74925.1 MAG: peptide-methionine (S)-S-oxide reductase [Candidatus Magasanikbacteria bacterium RIFCSPHIGHO2_12_FULL_41_16]OGH78227.1 MAG: peptide-methionine (S)-S-oxide reductase [Candidatus Magasanikbacteria bacterium RIFCSPLOWO2_01_FULL_40_15]